MRPLPIRHFFDLKATIAIFTVALFISTILALAKHLDDEVRLNFRQVLSAQQYQTVEHVASSLEEALRLRTNALEDASSLINPDWMTRSERLHLFMADLKPLHRFFNVGIFVISREGVGLADLPNIAGREGAGYIGRDYFKTVMTTGKAVVGKPILDRFTKKPVINIAVPIKNSGHEVIGVLVGANEIIGSDLLSEILPEKLRSNGEIDVISPRDGIYVSSTDVSRIMQSAPDVGTDAMFDRYREGYNGSGVSTNSTGIERLTSAKGVPSTGWIVVASLPTSIAFEPINTLRSKIYKDAAIASATIVILLWLFLHSQLNPLSRSAQLIDAMADGREPLRPLPLEGSKEIRRLLASFNKLQSQIEKQNHSLEEQAAQMQLAASVFEGTSEAILVSSADNRIITVNQAFCKMTGYNSDELTGQNPRLLQSGRHDEDFYQDMWSSLTRTGQWQGEIWNRRKTGEVYPERLTISTLFDDNGNVIRYIAIAADITGQKQADAVMWKQANYDLLTNLPNRRLLQERMSQVLANARVTGQSFAVLQIDLDHFSEVNRTFGSATGDLLIAEAGTRIAACAEPHATTVAHIGGDEFVVVLSEVADSAKGTESIASKIVGAIAEPFFCGSETIFISASIGITCYPTDARDLEGLFKNAESAKHVAKLNGRNRFCCYSEAIQVAAQTRVQLANDLRGAIAAKQFEVHYQPIVDLRNSTIVKAEALLRWHHPERGLVSPAQFIPIAEDTGLINEIGDWVFKEAAQMAKRCHSSDKQRETVALSRSDCVSLADEATSFQIAVNKSPRQFMGGTEKSWISYLQQNDIDPARITIEITEGLLLDQRTEVLSKFQAFRDAGIQIALDDFGTGYSAMSYLKKFEIDYLKIDRSFVHDISIDPGDLAIVEAVIVMAHKLGLQVVAEGVETAEQHELLRDAGCDFGQGYFYYMPMPARQFEQLFARHRPVETPF